MPKRHIPAEPKPRKPRAKGKRKTRNPTVGLVDRKPDGSPLAGHEARLASYVKRTLDLKRKDYTHGEVALMIAEEFNLVSIPAVTTVADWIKKGMNAVREDIEELQWQMRIEQFTQLDKLKAKWMPIATAQFLEVRRWVMVEGELQPEMDENAVKEQIEATKQVVNIMNRQAKLLGLDIDKAASKDGDGPSTLQDLQIWMVNQINMTTGAPNGGSIDVQSEVLELRSGLPEMGGGDAV